jgi:hypothetical protein
VNVEKRFEDFHTYESKIRQSTWQCSLASDVNAEIIKRKKFRFDFLYVILLCSDTQHVSAFIWPSLER